MPDVVLVNSCIWDLLRYDNKPLEAYKKNLDCLFSRLSEVLSPECLVIWNMTMPVGFKAGEMPQYSKHNLRWDIVEGNFYSATLANLHKMDVLDMHYYFRFDMHNRCKDATHWDKTAHRKYSQILMTHIADAWGVEPPEPTIVKFPLWNLPPPHPLYNDQENGHHHFGRPIQSKPPHGDLLRNVPYPQPPYAQESIRHALNPRTSPDT
ncbi:unnamed protein product, partial [Staurois parvus]